MSVFNVPTPSIPSSGFGDMFSAYPQPLPSANVHPLQQLPGIKSLDQRPVIDWDGVINALEAVKKSEQKLQPPITMASCSSQSMVHPSMAGTSSSYISSASTQPQSQSNQLDEDEIVSLIKNIKQLPETNQRDLITIMKDLEKVDPAKSERIRKKLIDSRGK